MFCSLARSLEVGLLDLTISFFLYSGLLGLPCLNSVSLSSTLQDQSPVSHSCESVYSTLSPSPVLSGNCVNCQGNTEGPSCEKCRYNFYRRPGSPVTDPCIPCPCSSVTSTGSCKLGESFPHARQASVAHVSIAC